MTESQDALALTPAEPEDAARILELREDAARWQTARGIRQWSPGEIPLDAIASQIADGEWWVDRAGRHGGISAAVRVVESDPLIWPGATSSGFLHGLVVDRDATGNHLGARVVAWAEREIAARGLAWIRLDCVASNARLRRYYRDLGFAEVDVIEYEPGSGWQPSARFEKRATPG